MSRPELINKIAEAIRTNDVEKLKELKADLNRDMWLEAWRASGKGMEAWLEPNPFIKWVDACVQKSHTSKASPLKAIIK